ncbi:MAG: single-stranded-DNA-specific exonuclease RecJ [Candidatus Competibacteraceae bacterium]|nr:single-stranded-DNA-specific exonuclease RecJ [Candidatus Competibacteraceae bacterium]HRY15180.1 single-stranded-DNA-specific exonuclease RecJ [Candidatus Competibacteraceae bacterium]
MLKSIVRRVCEPCNGLPAPPLLQRIYAARAVRLPHELQRELRLLTPPTALLNMERAVDLLHTALRERWRLLIIADFDADGATSCALAVRALRAMGVAWVGYRVPNRFAHGYGLTPEIVTIAAEDQPDLLITVDNGISSHAGVKTAQALGMKVLITDHHSPGSELPPAEGIVNPNLPGDAFPSKNIAGVGVIFYVMMALRARLREAGWFAERRLAEPNLARFLDLVAFGTVADVVRLDHHNRILVEQGLRRIRQGYCVPGITALCEVTSRPQIRLSAGDIGFYLGPRLNAAGRLEDMSQGIECLLSDNLEAARKIARRLHEINRQRGELTVEMETQALARIDRLAPEVGDLPFGLCLFDPEWHQGVVGIIAGRLKERLNRPVIVFATDRDGNIKGSGRSVPGMHLRDALAAVATQNPGLISHFGGHAMAAGLTLAMEHFDLFNQAFDAETRQWLSDDDLHGRLLSDGELAPDEFTLEIAELLREGGPWGQGFPEPLFDGVFEVLSHQVMKEKHLKLFLRLPGNGARLEAVAFNQVAAFRPGTARVRIAYQLDVNEWQGQRRLQLRVAHLEAA